MAFTTYADGIEVNGPVSPDVCSGLVYLEDRCLFLPCVLAGV
jgi:hypothetical protein